MGGFPVGSVALLRFDGHEDNDSFFPPQGPGAPGTGPVALAPPGTIPNIQFWGEDGGDVLLNRNDPEYFDGDDGPDVAWLGSPAGLGDGNDIYKGGAGIDFLFGGAGDDYLQGDADGDELSGGAGADLMRGGFGYDKLWGEGDNDMLLGEQDGDILYGGPHDDFLDTGSSGAATFTFTGGPPVAHFEYAYGGDGEDNITAENATGTSFLAGNEMNDRIRGSNFNDTIHGDDGQDLIEGRGGNDTIDGGNHADMLWSHGGGLVDQPWNGQPAQFVGLYDMKDSGPDDGWCDIEDSHPDDETVGSPPASVCHGGVVTAVDDSYSLSHKATLTIGAPGVMVNDFFPGGPPEPLVTVLFPTAHHTWFTWSSDGSFQYDPDDSFAGIDSFYYDLSLGASSSKKPGMVQITVTNQTPAANNDVGTTSMGTPANPVDIPVLSNDTDADPGEQLTPTIVTAPGVGSASVLPDPDGSGPLTSKIRYTPPAGWSGMTSFTYKVTDEIGAQSNTATVQVFVGGGPLMLDSPEVDSTDETRSITDADLALLVGEAANRWVTAGVDPVAMTGVLAETEFVIADLPGSMIGAETPGTIVIDVNAAGYGWFVDATAALDEEFSIEVTPSERQAEQGSAAYGRADLLTVLMHELGHALGMPHLEGEEHEHSVMHDTLGLSMRRSPTAADFMAADEYFAALAGTGSLIKRRT